MTSSYIPSADFSFKAHKNYMGNYLWNDKCVDAIFCNHCGIFVYIGNETYGYRINLGCVEEIDALSLNVKVLDGRSLPLAESPGSHPGDS